MHSSSRYDVPYHWWGPGPVPSAALTLPDLVGNGTLDLTWAVHLWASLANGRSLTIIGGPSGLGKSTLLHALLPALPSERSRIYLRGCYETFQFQRDPGLSPDGTTLLINEISPHLPIYLWGPAVRRTLMAGEDGCQILATAHGRSAMEFAASLTGSPLRIPAQLLSAFDLVALLKPTSAGVGRKLTELWQFSETRGGVAVDQLSNSDLANSVTRQQAAAAEAAILALTTSERTHLDLERTRAEE